jgi:DNA-binding protein HU-beta
MRKQALIRRIADQTGIDPVISQEVVESFFEVVKTSLTQGEPIYIRKFGSFILKRRAEKTARNISQNTAVVVAAHVVPAFKPSIEFRDQVRAQGDPPKRKKWGSKPV